MELYQKYKSLFDKYGVNTKLRISNFMGQIEHESHLKPISENLNYSADGLLKIFPKYFDKETASIFARNPKEIANRVYANRMGNGCSASNDGWDYRGRGFIQLTGKENYHNFSKDTGIDALNNPDLLLEEANAMIAALWFWNKNNLNALADKNDVTGITKRINGGVNGLAERKALVAKYQKQL